jgi:hypothetical protein
VTDPTTTSVDAESWPRVELRKLSSLQVRRIREWLQQHVGQENHQLVIYSRFHRPARLSGEWKCDACVYMNCSSEDLVLFQLTWL